MNRVQKLKTLLFGVLFLASLLAPVFYSQRVHALGETYTWDYAERISVRGGIVDTVQYMLRIGDSFSWVTSLPQASSPSGQCAAIILLVPSADAKSGTLSLKSGSGSCTQSDFNSWAGSGKVTLNNPERSGASTGDPIGSRTIHVRAFVLTDATGFQIGQGDYDSVSMPQEDEITLKRGTTVLDTKRGTLQVEASTVDGKRSGKLYYSAGFADAPDGTYAFEVCSKVAASCATDTKQDGEAIWVDITGKNNPYKIAIEASETPKSCENSGGGGDLSWLLCPVLRQMDNLVSSLDGLINDLLQVPDAYFNNPSLKDTWSRMRNIAYIILVPIILIMVISTALGFEFISAYTVKKALPRLVAAILFIALSYSILTFLIILTNNVGNGVSGLLTSSFTSSQLPGATESGTITLASLFAPSSGSSDAGVFMTILLAGTAAYAILSFGILLSYALVTVVALFIGFLALAFRQLFLIALLLVSPLAILAWIFPGNDKLWKVWWGSFSKLLLLYPLIMVMVGGGRAFARVVQIATVDGGVEFGNTNLITTLIKLTAYIGPYFFIPAAFKFAGGLFATLSGIANDRGKGLFDRNKKYRAEKAAKNYADWRKGDRAWRPKAINTLGRRLDAGAKGRYGFGKHGAAAFDIRSRANAAEAMKDPLMNQLQFDDDGILAMALSAGSKSQARAALQKLYPKWSAERIDKAVSAADSVGFNRSNATAALDMMARNKSFSLLGGPEGMEALIDATGRLSGGNQQMQENLLGSFAFNSRQAGRFDLGAFEKDKTTGKFVPSLDATWAKATVAQHAQGTGASMQSFAETFGTKFNTGVDSGNRTESMESAIALLEMKNMLPHATAANQEIINRTLQASGIDLDSDIPVEMQLAARISGGSITPGGGIDPRTGRPTPPTTDDETRRIAQQVRNRARVYDSSTPVGERGPGDEPTTTVTSADGT